MNRIILYKDALYIDNNDDKTIDLYIVVPNKALVAG